MHAGTPATMGRCLTEQVRLRHNTHLINISSLSTSHSCTQAMRWHSHHPPVGPLHASGPWAGALHACPLSRPRSLEALDQTCIAKWTRCSASCISIPAADASTMTMAWRPHARNGEPCIFSELGHPVCASSPQFAYQRRCQCNSD